ncbi:PREDICTED: peroxisomal membrane protein PEX14 [Rhagoletis zephyria]|uniref:peroxisomal membrane protein PEX14 n=1 Tax=Rhagoletis zephyria TaxID=28612 RepID=UPI000811715B|nr:PREDICTED: peroxisomal membrane protein PEX14 [Rhagoletis zephyria]
MATSNTDTGDTTIIASSTEIQGGEPTPLDAVAPREALITTAVNFLQNAKVRHTSLMQKRQFLQSKGLTNEEVEIACRRAGAFRDDTNTSPTVINMGISSSAYPQLALQPRQSAFGRIKEVLHNLALISGVAYAIYLFWKKYVEPYLFGKKKKKPVDDALEDIDKKVDSRLEEVSVELARIKEQMQEQQREQRQSLNQEFNVFRSDLEAIKGLLLNRKQFAAPLSTGPASIPAWQLAATPHRLHTHLSHSDDNEKVDDAGSGSGSSETEVVTKNSDSSLEMM